MAKTKSTIVINGRNYDAVTGTVLSGKKLMSRVKNKLPTSGVVMDGVMRPSAKRPTKPAKPSAKRNYKRVDSSAKAQDLHSKTQRSYTLVRTAAKKAIPNLPKIENPKAKSKIISVDPKRLERAKLVSMNTNVNKFGFSGAPLPSRPSKIISEFANRAPSQITKAPSRTLAATKTAASHVPILATKIVQHPASKQLASILDDAIERADSHRQTFQRKSKINQLWEKIIQIPRWITISFASLLVVAVAGFFALQNIPSVAINVASKRAGFSAIHPAYTPAGFGYQDIDYAENNVNIKYKAAADGNRIYTVNQQPSNWNSSTLLSEFVKQGGQTYQTAQSNGKTIYVYGKSSNLTWVDAGIWFNIENNADLNSEQMLKIADGL